MFKKTYLSNFLKVWPPAGPQDARIFLDLKIKERRR
jgi:hypothetical protein